MRSTIRFALFLVSAALAAGSLPVSHASAQFTHRRAILNPDLGDGDRFGDQ